MLANRFEQQNTPELKWNRIEDIPDFPISTYEEVKQKVASKEFLLGIDYTTANHLGQWLYGKGYTAFSYILSCAPFLVAIASPILAIILRNWWLLAGMLLGFIGQLSSNPFNPWRGFLRLIAATVFLVFIWASSQARMTVALLSAFFVFPFFINGFLYSMNQKKLYRVALDSEKIFIFLYQTGKLGLKHRESGKSYWNREALLEETKRLLGL